MATPPCPCWWAVEWVTFWRQELYQKHQERDHFEQQLQTAQAQIADLRVRLNTEKTRLRDQGDECQRQLTECQSQRDEAVAERTRLFRLLHTAVVDREGSTKASCDAFPDGSVLVRRFQHASRASETVLLEWADWCVTQKDSNRDEATLTEIGWTLQNIIQPCAEYAQEHAAWSVGQKRQELERFLGASLEEDNLLHSLVWTSRMQEWAYASAQASSLLEWKDTAPLSPELQQALDCKEFSDDQTNLGEFMKQLVDLTWFASLSRPQCYLSPAIGEVISYCPQQHKFLRLAHSPAPQPGDLVHVVYPGLYFEDPHKAAVEPAVKAMVIVIPDISTDVIVGDTHKSGEGWSPPPSLDTPRQEEDMVDDDILQTCDSSRSPKHHQEDSPLSIPQNAPPLMGPDDKVAHDTQEAGDLGVSPPLQVPTLAACNDAAAIPVCAEGIPAQASVGDTSTAFSHEPISPHEEQDADRERGIMYCPEEGHSTAPPRMATCPPGVEATPVHIGVTLTVPNSDDVGFDNDPVTTGAKEPAADAGGGVPDCANPQSIDATTHYQYDMGDDAGGESQIRLTDLLVPNRGGKDDENGSVRVPCTEELKGPPDSLCTNAMPKGGEKDECPAQGQLCDGPRPFVPANSSNVVVAPAVEVAEGTVAPQVWTDDGFPYFIGGLEEQDVAGLMESGMLDSNVSVLSNVEDDPSPETPAPHDDNGNHGVDFPMSDVLSSGGMEMSSPDLLLSSRTEKDECCVEELREGAPDEASDDNCSLDDESVSLSDEELKCAPSPPISPVDDDLWQEGCHHNDEKSLYKSLLSEERKGATGTSVDDVLGQTASDPMSLDENCLSDGEGSWEAIPAPYLENRVEDDANSL